MNVYFDEGGEKMRIDILIFANQVGMVPLLISSFMILLSFVAAALITSHWKESKEVTE